MRPGKLADYFPRYIFCSWSFWSCSRCSTSFSRFHIPASCSTSFSRFHILAGLLRTTPQQHMPTTAPSPQIFPSSRWAGESSSSSFLPQVLWKVHDHRPTGQVSLSCPCLDCVYNCHTATYFWLLYALGRWVGLSFFRPESGLLIVFAISMPYIIRSLFLNWCSPDMVVRTTSTTCWTDTATLPPGWTCRRASTSTHTSQVEKSYICSCRHFLQL